MMMDSNDALQKAYKHHLTLSYNDPSYFAAVILGKEHWKKQRAICKLVVDHQITVVVSGNGLGKTSVACDLALWALFTHPGSIVVTTAPTATQLREALWAHIRSSFYNARFPLPGKIKGAPNSKLVVDESMRWHMIGLTTTAEEKLSGQHSSTGYVFVVVDEGSGVKPEIFSALDGLNYDKMLIVGNPLRNDGVFYELAQKAVLERSAGKKPTIGYLHISSLESPDADRKGKTGLADKKWFEGMEAKWGRNSLWWRTHIDGLFPDSNEDALIPSEWLDNLATTQVPYGPRRIAVDYAEGRGGDPAVILCRDDNGIYDIQSSNTWGIEELTKRTASMAAKYRVQPSYITWDSTGAGSDWGNRLRGAGLFGCRPFKGSCKVRSSAQGINLRANAAWKMRRRLDPSRRVIDPSRGNPIQDKFFISPAHLVTLRPELQSMTYELSNNGKIQLKSKESVRAILGRSPDWADALLISFAFH